jgi:nucleotide-binding universal stress UspA family protein
MTKVNTDLADANIDLSDTAKKFNVNMIVIGSRALSQIKELLLGSVSHSVIKHADIPILVVK